MDSNVMCIGCGLCASVCPTNALKIVLKNGRYTPTILSDECIGCNLCKKVCNYDENLILKQSSISIPKTSSKFHSFLGNFLNCYMGYSSDLKIRKNSASGGLITSILLYLLESGKIDGAIVTKLKYKGKNLETEPFIARNKKEIISASGSYYIPVNFSEVIKKIKEEDNDACFAIVALPCVASKIRMLRNDIHWLNKIQYIFGLFCSHNFNYYVLDYIKQKISLQDNTNIQSFNFRSGWPESTISIQTERGEYKLHPKHWNFLFTLKMYPMSKRCLICNDFSAELADISFGDAWLPQIKRTDKMGTSICISRTREGQEILSEATNQGYISISEIRPSQVIESQRFAVYF